MILNFKIVVTSEHIPMEGLERYVSEVRIQLAKEAMRTTYEHSPGILKSYSILVDKDDTPVVVFRFNEGIRIYDIHTTLQCFTGYYGASLKRRDKTSIFTKKIDYILINDVSQLINWKSKTYKYIVIRRKWLKK